MVFNLDPADGGFATARRAALALRDLLADLGLPALVKTGGKGLHMHVPLDRSMDFDGVREFARGVAEVLAARDPKRYTTEERKEQRHGRLFLDVMCNAYAQTAVSPYAVRARAGATVATPWTGARWRIVACARTGSPCTPCPSASNETAIPGAGRGRRRSLRPARRGLDRLLAEQHQHST
jgi:bifunctional non-homologous end joining protein LigD